MTVSLIGCAMTRKVTVLERWRIRSIPENPWYQPGKHHRAVAVDVSGTHCGKSGLLESSQCK